MSVLWGDDPRTDGAEWGQARLLSLLALFVLLACLLARGHRTPDKTPNKTPNKVSQMRVR